MQSEPVSPPDAVLLRQEFEGEVDAFQFTSRDAEVAGYRRAGGNYYRIESLLLEGNGGGLYAVAEHDAFLFQQTKSTVDDSLVEFEVGDAIAK